MSTRHIRKRLAKVEVLIGPKRDDGRYTLEELCPAIWRQDEDGYRKMVDRECGSLGHFIPQFEREDLERIRG